jgi:hypothetical protein
MYLKIIAEIQKQERKNKVMRTGISDQIKPTQSGIALSFTFLL